MNVSELKKALEGVPDDDTTPQAERVPSGSAMETARKIASEINVEHDDSMQANCSICQRVIPFIATALTAAAQSARALALEEAEAEAAGRDCKPYDDVQRGMARLIRDDIQRLPRAPQHSTGGQK